MLDDWTFLLVLTPVAVLAAWLRYARHGRDAENFWFDAPWKMVVMTAVAIGALIALIAKVTGP